VSCLRRWRLFSIVTSNQEKHLLMQEIWVSMRTNMILNSSLLLKNGVWGRCVLSLNLYYIDNILHVMYQRYVLHSMHDIHMPGPQLRWLDMSYLWRHQFNTMQTMWFAVDNAPPPKYFSFLLQSLPYSLPLRCAIGMASFLEVMCLIYLYALHI
jgi:hypothetical protein